MKLKICVIIENNKEIQTITTIKYSEIYNLKKKCSFVMTLNYLNYFNC